MLFNLILAKEQLNRIKTNIIADSYYCNTINVEPFQQGFNPINYRFNNPYYQQPVMNGSSFGGSVFNTTRCPPSDQHAPCEYPDMSQHRNDPEQK